VSWDSIRAGLDAVTSLRGRMQRIETGRDFMLIVDFAHTPNALRSALTSGRGLTGPSGRVIVVFGCAGLRDREKRRLMPQAAHGLADYSIFTAEDPRSESLDEILATMADAAQSAGGREGETFERIPDRGAAILRAVALARPGDVVLLCGKGHEQSMAFGTVEYPWDDADAARAALRGDAAALRTLPTAI
jgi:UDP-N-acetylmuramoyl-L-alanyl-D-glutamate--2,6-diaminopimelate ligase